MAQHERIYLQCGRRALSLGREAPLEEGTATHSSILARRIPGTEESGGLQSIGLQRQTRVKQPSRHACMFKHVIKVI